MLNLVLRGLGECYTWWGSAWPHSDLGAGAPVTSMDRRRFLSL